jgi:hypothetical protein
MQKHFDTALQHLISGLRECGIIIHIFSQGEGADFGLSYETAGAFGPYTTTVVAVCTWNGGLEFSDEPDREVKAAIKAHCTLYYGTKRN